MTHPTADRVRSLLSYDELTGVFVWRVNVGRWGRIKAGTIAGNRCDGYIQIGFDGRQFQAHQLAWLVKTGRWPSEEMEIDHRNTVRDDNRWDNLRELTRRGNTENKRAALRNNIVGLLGVSPSLSKFQARIKVAGHMKYLGTFDTPELAHAAYVAAKRELHQGNTL